MRLRPARCGQYADSQQLCFVAAAVCHQARIGTCSSAPIASLCCSTVLQSRVLRLCVYFCPLQRRYEHSGHWLMTRSAGRCTTALARKIAWCARTTCEPHVSSILLVCCSCCTCALTLLRVPRAIPIGISRAPGYSHCPAHRLPRSSPPCPSPCSPCPPCARHHSQLHKRPYSCPCLPSCPHPVLRRLHERSLHAQVQGAIPAFSASPTSRSDFKRVAAKLWR